MYRIHVMISGKVQGVFFRISAQDKANELNLTGWVKNIFNILTTTCLENDSNAIYAMSHRSDNITTKRIHDSMSDVSYIVRRRPNRPKKTCCTSHDHAPYTTSTTSATGPRVPDLTDRQITPRK